MAMARLPQHCTIEALAKQLGQAGAFDGDWESLVLFCRVEHWRAQP
jgi:hypothetical protein